ncbi:MAG: hypothetical protein M3P24_11445, partial [Gemmatimonadota bacterium]|nr:hypothetical protein [Gemmatimonadota bacterium]
PAGARESIRRLDDRLQQFVAVARHDADPLPNQEAFERKSLALLEQLAGEIEADHGSVVSLLTVD